MQLASGTKDILQTMSENENRQSYSQAKTKIKEKFKKKIII